MLARLAPHAAVHRTLVLCDPASAYPMPSPLTPACPQMLGLPTFMPEEDWAVDYDAGEWSAQQWG